MGKDRLGSILISCWRLFGLFISGRLDALRFGAVIVVRTDSEGLG